MTDEPHITIGGEPPADQRIEECWVLVAITPNGGEGVYSQTIGRHMHNFVATEAGMKDTLEDYLRERGTVETARQASVHLEWRLLGGVTKRVEIT